MFAQTVVVAGLLLAAPPERPAGPQFEKGLEIRWAGTFAEASFRPGVRAARTYDVDARLFVLDTGEYGAEAILFTRVFLKPARPTPQPPTGIVHLELVRIDPKGRVQILPSPADPDNPVPKARPWPAVQLHGLPTHEAGFFFEFPDQPLKPGLTWAREEAGRPVVRWKAAEADSFLGHPALKLVAEQTTAGYDRPRIRRVEWRKQETLTVVPAHGFGARLERVIEMRDPEAEDLSFRSVLNLEQQGRIVYPGRLYQERREEGLHAAAFTAMLERALATSGREGVKPFEAVARRVRAYLADHGTNDMVPFREAVLAVRKRAEAAARGDLPPAPPPDNTAPPADPLAVGKLIPDITPPEITGPGSIRLGQLKGKPVLLVYFQPSAASGRPVLKLADGLHARKLAAVIPLAIGDPADGKKLAADLRAKVPVYDGTGVYKVHGLEATPVFVVIDADGVIRHVIRGWGGETPAAVTREVERWAK